MGILMDLLKDVPLSAVLKERVALAEQQVEAWKREAEELRNRNAALEQENAELRARIPVKVEISLQPVTAQVLRYLFDAQIYLDCEIGQIASQLGLHRNEVRYHLDRLREFGFADEAGATERDVYWSLTADGLKYVMEQKLS